MVTMALCDYPQWVWDDVLDILYDRATREWECDRPEVADALAEVADALAKDPVLVVARGER
jgi:hypothetical protein